MPTRSVMHDILKLAQSFPVTVQVEDLEERNKVMCRLINASKHPQHEGQKYLFSGVLVIRDEETIVRAVSVTVE